MHFTMTRKQQELQNALQQLKKLTTGNIRLKQRAEALESLLISKRFESERFLKDNIIHLSDTDSVGSDSSQSTSDDSLLFMGDCDSKLQQARINLPSFALICKSFAAVANAVIKNLNSSNL